MKFEKNYSADFDESAFVEPGYGRLNYQAKKKSLEEEDAEFEENFTEDEQAEKDLDDLLDKFDDDIDEIDLDDMDLDEFDEELNDDNIDVFDDDIDAVGSKRRSRSKKGLDPEEDEIDDSKFYNDEFKDFDNYTTISDLEDEDIDTYIENENYSGGGYYDYDDRY